jgi:hypothetical protein
MNFSHFSRLEGGRFIGKMLNFQKILRALAAKASAFFIDDII